MKHALPTGTEDTIVDFLAVSVTIIIAINLFPDVVCMGLVDRWENVCLANSLWVRL